MTLLRQGLKGLTMTLFLIQLVNFTKRYFITMIPVYCLTKNEKKINKDLEILKQGKRNLPIKAKCYKTFLSAIHE